MAAPETAAPVTGDWSAEAHATKSQPKAMARKTRREQKSVSPDANGHLAKDEPPDAGPKSAGGGAVAASIVRQAQVEAKGDRTIFRLRLSVGVRAEVFTLANPYRIIIDLPDVAFALPDGTGRKGDGLISAFRYGLFADRKARVVLDATGPVRIDGARMTTSADRRDTNLEIELAAISADEFGAGTGAGTPPPVSRSAIYDDVPAPANEAEKPLILIDPGHGGIDPGALGENNILEKSVVLAVAKKLRRRLEATGHYRVVMTRSSDVFVSLDQRLRMSHKLHASLFISLHADAIASKTYASVVRGATVYTLSERASDEQARLMAEKENASDLVAGLEGAASDHASDEVRSILFDLMKRESANFSTDFSNILVNRLKSEISLSRDPQRSAAFKVLKQTHAPSVLVELGFMSNAVDSKLMRQSEWQGKVAGAIVSAVNAFFAKRTARKAR